MRRLLERMNQRKPHQPVQNVINIISHEPRDSLQLQLDFYIVNIIILKCIQKQYII